MALDPVKNFAKVQVSLGYNDTDTSIVLVSNDGAKLPAPATDGPFNLVWWNASDYGDPADDPNVEIVRVTARTTDTLTVTRNQEDSGASAKNTADKIYKMVLAMTKKMKDDIEIGNIEYIPSETLRHSSDTEKSANSTSYVKIKEIKVDIFDTLGEITIKFDLKCAADETGYGRVYKNGVALGTEQSVVSATYVTKSEDLGSFVKDDLIQIYVKRGVTNERITYVENFRLYYDLKYIEKVLFTDFTNQDP